MYVLFEKWDWHMDDSFANYDAMGIVKTEAEAQAWRDKNPECREYVFVYDAEGKPTRLIKEGE